MAKIDDGSKPDSKQMAGSPQFVKSPMKDALMNKQFYFFT